MEVPFVTLGPDILVLRRIDELCRYTYSIRRAQPPESPERIEGSAEMLRSTATDSDRALRALYRGFTETS